MYGNPNHTNDDLLLDYPMSKYRGQDIFVGMNMIGAQLSGN